MTVKEHYDKHLGDFYAWMMGDFAEKQLEQQLFFQRHNIAPASTGYAVDLGAGNGIQSVSLAKLGFRVKALDFNRKLLSELKHNSKGLKVEAIEDDIRSLSKYADPQPELIVCMGDTIAHLDSQKEIELLLIDGIAALDYNGKLIISFRDYTKEVLGDNRFIPVKSDDNRILTCVLEYYPDFIRVTDLLYEKEKTGWKQKASSYIKVRVSAASIKKCLVKNGMKIDFEESVNKTITLITSKI